MIRKTFKILHIPSAEMLIVKTSHSKNFAQFEEEFKIAGQFIVASTPDLPALIKITKKLNFDLYKLNLRYPKEHMAETRSPFFKEPFWIYDLVEFMTHLVGIDIECEGFEKVSWDRINLDEFEILE